MVKAFKSQRLQVQLLPTVLLSGNNDVSVIRQNKLLPVSATCCDVLKTGRYIIIALAMYHWIKTLTALIVCSYNCVALLCIYLYSVLLSCWTNKRVHKEVYLSTALGHNCPIREMDNKWVNRPYPCTVHRWCGFKTKKINYNYVRKNKENASTYYTKHNLFSII